MKNALVYPPIDFNFKMGTHDVRVVPVIFVNGHVFI